MARDSLSVDKYSVAVNGTTGYFVADHTVQRLTLAPWETILGPKVIVEWSE